MIDDKFLQKIFACITILAVGIFAEVADVELQANQTLTRVAR